jgi:hypothetical protein
MSSRHQHPTEPRHASKASFNEAKKNHPYAVLSKKPKCGSLYGGVKIVVKEGNDGTIYVFLKMSSESPVCAGHIYYWDSSQKDTLNFFLNNLLQYHVLQKNGIVNKTRASVKDFLGLNDTQNEWLNDKTAAKSAKRKAAKKLKNDEEPAKRKRKAKADEEPPKKRKTKVSEEEHTQPKNVEEEPNEPTLPENDDDMRMDSFNFDPTNKSIQYLTEPPPFPFFWAEATPRFQEGYAQKTAIGLAYLKRSKTTK